MTNISHIQVDFSFFYKNNTTTIVARIFSKKFHELNRHKKYTSSAPKHTWKP